MTLYFLHNHFSINLSTYIHTAVIASLERAEYSVLESDECLEVCVRLVGRYQSSITVYLCIEGINATGRHHPI